MVNVKTSADDIKAKLSIQNTKWESIKSIQKNHLPKSTYVEYPWIKIWYNSNKEINNTVEKVIKEP